ncbi:MAG: arginine--tRNA ligase [Gammaproteobacteria bacterium]|nr:arginine--tRNA ligase [Gammaproteobacteria bacterium]
MKQPIEKLLQSVIKQMQEAGELPASAAFIQIEATKDKAHGDFASNIALTLAKPAQKKPRAIAERIAELIPKSDYIEKVEVAGPGFINFFLSSAALSQVVTRILEEGDRYGITEMGLGKKVLVEFVSSNPTGPLHVGHGRHAAFGDVLANLLDAVGFKTYREYYVNDGGRQMDIIAVSIWLRYLEFCGEGFEFPANGYKGEYVKSIAQAIFDVHRDHFCASIQTLCKDLPPDEPQGGDKEIYIDCLIERAKSLLGPKYEVIFDLGLNQILSDIREDLIEFGVHYDNWFSEKTLVESNIVDEVIKKLRADNFVYESEGALWFASTRLGDEKDRVLVRSNGQRTYFANDVAYHINKFERGFDIAIDLFGSDHHGYIPRIRAAVQAFGVNPERLLPLLVQFVSLYRQGKPVSMSTRGGNFVTLRELREEVGNDAARFFYVMRKCEQHMDFDLDLAKSKSNENPVFYVQYAHARICSVFYQMKERGIAFDQEQGLAHLDLLKSAHERQLLNTMSAYPDTIVDAALNYETHQLTNYLRELATDFHAYYNAEQFLVEDAAERNAKLALIMATKQTLANGFKLLGISAPESM